MIEFCTAPQILPKLDTALVKTISPSESTVNNFGVTTFRWTQKLRLSALTLEDEKSKQPLQLGI